jgi:hypothetical protein
MLIEQCVAVKLFEKVECHVGFVLLARIADDGQIALKADRVNLMAHGLEGSDDIVLRPPGLLFLGGINSWVSSTRIRSLVFGLNLTVESGDSLSAGPA